MRTLRASVCGEQKRCRCASCTRARLAYAVCVCMCSVHAAQHTAWGVHAKMRTRTRNMFMRAGKVVVVGAAAAATAAGAAGLGGMARSVCALGFCARLSEPGARTRREPATLHQTTHAANIYHIQYSGIVRFVLNLNDYHY